MGSEKSIGRVFASTGGYTLLLLMLVQLAAMLDRVILSVLLQPIKLDFHLTDTQLGFVSGLGFSLALSLAVLPMGYLADRVNRKRALVVIVSTWSLLTVMSGLAPGFPLLCLARIGLGFAEGGQSPFVVSLIGDFFPSRYRATALSFMYMGVPLGMLGGLLVGGMAAAAYGWHVAMMVAGAPGLALALVIGLTLREPRRGQQDDQPQTSAQPLDFRQSLAFIVRTPALVHMFIGGALASSVVCVMGVWLPALLMRDFSASIGKVGPALAFSGGALGVLGSLICGPIADRLGQGSPARMAFLTASFVLLFFPAAQLCVTAGGFNSALVFNGLFNLLVPGYLACLHSTVLGVAHARVRGFAVASLAIMLNLVGYGLGPQFVGMASDWFAARHAALPLRDAMVVLFVAALWGSAHFYYAARLLRSNGRLTSAPPAPAT